jgi:hypothetical protein
VILTGAQLHVVTVPDCWHWATPVGVAVHRYHALAPGPAVPSHCQPVVEVYQASQGRTSIVLAVGSLLKLGASSCAWSPVPQRSPLKLVQTDVIGVLAPTASDRR